MRRQAGQKTNLRRKQVPRDRRKVSRPLFCRNRPFKFQRILPKTPPREVPGVAIVTVNLVPHQNI
jgi:hypothetical protein